MKLPDNGLQLAALTLVLLLSGCTVYPSKVPLDQGYARCELVSRQLALNYEWLEANTHANLLRGLGDCQQSTEVCLAAYCGDYRWLDRRQRHRLRLSISRR
ncbi:hypothetical protein [Thalassolituus alkanivorans]|uniref:hypothetical protein n=1 Tax=Thalassolituus alkanivorans TaxID=2881055 RepID=UPI001E5F4032|nr:hypothetical protein [Thalassolituus alkanivorans]MCB2387155.1 hypothetical protein [Thalassolituus alkanivorans]MCB2422702.1 hypothetical protein [Thalassolituus alkanivorans]